ncbi:major capsid family protein [Sphingobium sp. ZW T5_29]|uniref:major capsid family protein n=1 Tax=Sphingobium sp. ZW T5_29 TaxID=3378077 RepID=UPI00385490C8
MNQPFVDAQAAFPFVIAQGRNIETRIYRKRYPTYNYNQVIPVVTEGNQWSIGTTFFSIDSAGEAKFLSGAGTDMPFNKSTKGQASHDFAMIGSGWEWTIEEINQAVLYGIDLLGTDAMSATDKIERLLNSIAFVGATEKNWTGFANSADVPRADVDTPGTFWPAKSADQMLTDVNEVIGRVRTQTNEIEWADSLALPPAAFRAAATKRLGSGDGLITVLEYIRKNNIYTAETDQPLNIYPVRELATASQDGGGRMVAYRKDEEVLRFHLPMPRTVLQPRQKSIMGFEQGIIARTGGTEWRLPKAAAYADEVTAPPA